MIYGSHITNRGYLKVQGEDALEFLQGLVTNDLRKVTENCSVYALLLTPQGKYSYDFIISFDPDDGYFIEGDRDRLKALFSRLTLYKLRSKVVLTIEEDYQVLALWSQPEDLVYESLELEKELGTTRHTKLWTVMVDPRSISLGCRLRVHKDQLSEVKNCLGMTLVDEEDYKYHRIGLGIPEGASELIIDKSIPLECGMNEFHAIDWNKGCYVGQELTARTKYRGLVRKGLFCFVAMGPVDQQSPLVLEDGTSVGVWYTLCRDRGLALVRLEAIGQPISCSGVGVLKR